MKKHTDIPPRRERVKEFMCRFDLASPVDSEDAALALIKEVLDQVEDEMTDIPNIPANRKKDGRLYPPTPPLALPHCEGVNYYRCGTHTILIAENGAVDIRRPGGDTVLIKPGKDGRHVTDYEN